MKKTDVRPQQGNNSDIRRKEKENRQLQLQLRTEKEKLNNTIFKYQKEMNDMQAVSDIKYKCKRNVTTRKHIHRSTYNT